MNIAMELVALFTGLGSLIGMIYFGLSRITRDVHGILTMLVETRELTRLNRVTLDTLQIVDNDTAKQIEQMRNRLASLEAYLKLYTEQPIPGNKLHSFKGRKE